ncbi:MAG: heat-shock protein Hsp20 [Betaproteobacteria bacterium RIFCSPLOWO2_12_FULL_62_58]|nr:MAG: heat-shock protein Hsp20 [Betaproteobacteria bacterium RIFCSPLOWO2_12_FULL_62_58]
MATETRQDVTVRKGTEIEKAAPRRMLSPFDEVDRLFERIFPRGWLRPLGWESPLLSEFAEPFEMRMPRVDVFDGEENVIIRAEVPGVDKKDLEVSVNDTSATIKGKVIREAKEEKAEYYRCEIGSGEFSRTVTLPCAVDASKASAQLKDGMLELTLPKVEKSKRHTIKIA